MYFKSSKRSRSVSFLNQFDAQTATTLALCHSVPEIHHCDARRLVSVKGIITLQEHGVDLSDRFTFTPLVECLYAERLIRTLKEEAFNINDYLSLPRPEIAYFITRCITGNAHTRR